MKRDVRGSTTTDSAGLAGGGITDTAIRKATGKGWGEWYDLLDSAGAREMTHQQLRSVIGREGAGEWWQQMIAVAYEQARGIRGKQHKDEGFAATASKTLKAGVTRVYAAWTEDEARSAWIDSTGWNIRRATPYKNLRITWVDGHSHIEVFLWPRGEGRTLIQVEHNKLGSLGDVQRLKAFWGVALERLRELLETADQPAALSA